MRDLIFLEQAPSKGQEHSPDVVGTVGREGCDVNIEDTEVSRRHAAIRREGDAVVVEDLGSTNGTFVNGERISGAHSLGEGDEVRFGATIWRLQVRSGQTVPGRQVVDDLQVTAARSVTRPREQPPAPAQSASAGPSGDVPPPSFAPSVIRRVVPPAGGPAPFNAPNPAAAGRGSAARRQGATAFVTLSVALTTVGVVLYYVIEPFK